MDGLSAAASIVTLVVLATKICVTCQEYSVKVKEARKDIKQLTDEITSLTDVLDELQGVLEGPNAAQQLPASHPLRGTDGPLESCRVLLDDVAKKLEIKRGAKWKWPFREKEVNKIIESIGRQKSSLGLALTVDNTSLAICTNKELVELRQSIAAAQHDTERNTILHWLCNIDPSSNHNAAREKYEQETGRWFFEDTRFDTWRTRPNSVLWLHGKAGSGKSILCSTIIQQVQDLTRPKPNVAIAYFYFDFNDSSKQNVASLIRSLSLQLCRQRADTPTKLAQSYAECLREHSPTTEDLFQILLASIKGFEEVFIIIDALDECPIKFNHRTKLLDWVRRIHNAECESIHLLMTSRKEVDIEREIAPLIKDKNDGIIDVQADLIQADICRYIDNTLNSSRFQRWPAKKKEEATKVLKEGADGMFRWVALHLDRLQSLSQPKKITEALRSIPKTLDQTYEQMLMDIDEDYVDQVIAALSLIAFSKGPLALTELAEAMLIDRKRRPSLDLEDRYFEPSQALRFTRGLIIDFKASKASFEGFTIDSDLRSYSQDFQKKVKFAHFSVQEYLVSERILESRASRFWIKESDAQMLITKNCALYLLQFAQTVAYLLGFTSLRALAFALQERAPFLVYASCYWTYHAVQLDSSCWNEDLKSLYLELLTSNPDAYINWLIIGNQNHYGMPFMYLRHVYDNKLDSFVPPTMDLPLFALPLYYIAASGIVDLVPALLNHGAQVDALGGRMNSALQAASHYGHLEIAQLLINAGANVNLYGGNPGCALTAASARGSLDMFRLLLRSGAQIRYRTLKEALQTGNPKVFKLLFDEVADVNTHRQKLSGLLNVAVSYDNVEVAKMLLDRGAKVNTTRLPRYTRTLNLAAHMGSLELVQLLIDYVAENKIDTYSDAMCSASEEGDLQVVRYLLDKGADMNFQVPKPGIPEIYNYSPFLTTAAFWRVDVMEEFLTRGANVNARSQEGLTALMIALSVKNRWDFSKQEQVVRLLIERGADVHIKGPDGDALQQAVKLRDGPNYSEEPNRVRIEAVIDVLQKASLSRDCGVSSSS
ncbi:MAG: hypothetical protein M1814_001414 [Vezdaea aestivalis]|nr:MAG: hypothetical protein M1814_001414 [Vezdaea aestivalis]